MELARSQPSEKCKNCGETVFMQGFIVKVVSSLMAGTPEDVALNTPIMLCAECGLPWSKGETSNEQDPQKN
jgi:hypothetical protein